MGNQCCQNCCLKKEDSKQSSQLTEKEIEQQQTIDFKIQKGPTNINVLHKQLYQTNTTVYVSSCDEKGKSPNNSIIDKNLKLAELLSKQNNTIGQISVLQNDKIYIFLVLPLYMGEDLQITQLKIQLQDLIKLLIEKGYQDISIEDVGVKRFGFPRQIVAKIVVEIFASNLHRIVNLNRIDFMLYDIKSKILFEAEIQARRQQLVKQDSLLKIDASEDKSLRQALIS